MSLETHQIEQKFTNGNIDLSKEIKSPYKYRGFHKNVISPMEMYFWPSKHNVALENIMSASKIGFLCIWHSVRYNLLNLVFHSGYNRTVAAY